MKQKTMKFALSIKLQLLFNFIINIMLKLVIYINGLLLAYKQWGYVSHNNVRSDTPKVAVFPISFTKTIYTISTQLHMTNVRPDVGTGPYIVSYSNNQMSIIFNIEHSGVIMDGAWWLVIGK